MLKTYLAILLNLRRNHMNINNLMKQAQQMQRKMDKIQKELEEKEYFFSSQGDAIKGIINGKMEILSLEISENLLEDKEMLQDILIMTLNDQLKKVSQDKENAMSQITGGMNIPGLF